MFALTYLRLKISHDVWCTQPTFLDLLDSTARYDLVLVIKHFTSKDVCIRPFTKKNFSMTVIPKSPSGAGFPSTTKRRPIFVAIGLTQSYKLFSKTESREANSLRHVNDPHSSTKTHLLDGNTTVYDCAPSCSAKEMMSRRSSTPPCPPGRGMSAFCISARRIGVTTCPKPTWYT